MTCLSRTLCCVLGLCALAGTSLASLRTLYPLLSNARRPPTFTLPDTQGTPVAMDTFLRHKRIVVLAIPAGAGLQGTTFLRSVQKNRAGFDERDLVVLALVPPQSVLSKEFDVTPVHMLQDKDGKVARAYGGSSGSPAFYLIGKDGGIKLARRTFPSLRELFGTIDAMPMRQEEAGRRGR